MGLRRFLAAAMSFAMAVTVTGGSVLTAPAADAAPAWSLVTALGPGSAPKEVTNRAGLMVAVWRVGFTQVWASFRAPGGDWQAPVRVADVNSAGTGTTALAGPEVVLDEAGTATVLWSELRGGSSGGLVYSVAGTAAGWSAPELRQGTMPGPSEAFSPDAPLMATGRDGTVHALWSASSCTERRQGPRDAGACLSSVTARYVATRSPAGSWTSPEPFDADLAAVSGIVVAPDDTVVVVGDNPVPSADATNRRNAVVTTRPAGGAWSPVKVLNTPGRAMAFSMKVHVVADDSGITAAFGECDSARVCHVGSSRGPAFESVAVLSREVAHGPRTGVTIYEDPVRLASSPHGDVTALWDLDGGTVDGSDLRIEASRRDRRSGAWESAHTVADGLSSGGTFLGDLVVDDDGTAAASWNAIGYDADGFHRTPFVTLRGADNAWGPAAELRFREAVDRGSVSVGALSTRGGAGLSALATFKTKASSGTANGYGVGWSDRTDDTGAPVSRMTKPSVAPATSTRFLVSWSASDGQSAVARTEVQRRAATWRGTFARWSAWTTSSRNGSSAATYRGYAGRTYCFRARSTDAAGNVGAWSTGLCRTTPVDDRAARVSPGWKRVTVTGSYLGTETTTTRRGARLALTGAHAHRYALLATTCRSCGWVRVSIGSKVVRVISLRSTRTMRRHVLPIATYRRVHTVPITVTVVSRGKAVRIDGIVASR